MKADDDALLGLARKNWTTAAIAHRFGMTQRAVRLRLARLEAEGEIPAAAPRKTGRPAAAGTDREISDAERIAVDQAAQRDLAHPGGGAKDELIAELPACSLRQMFAATTDARLRDKIARELQDRAPFIPPAVTRAGTDGTSATLLAMGAR